MRFIFTIMQIITSLPELKSTLQVFRNQKDKMGLVPTMGALHAGHISLIKQSLQENTRTVISIFVNPTQFNDKNDLRNYPRNLEADLALLKPHPIDIVFFPSDAEMYPEPDTRVFDFGNLDKVMEGKNRPGHFNGVAQIVSKLFRAVEPDRAYFGEKDFQQLTIINQLVVQLRLNITIVPCPIIRETDGLALSSRNALLNEDQRKRALRISQTLFESKIRQKSTPVDVLKNWVIATINQDSQLRVEYFEIVEDVNLQAVKSWDEPTSKVGCITVKVGNVRLIDNIRYNA